MSAKRSSSRSAIGAGLATLVTIMVAVLLTTFSVLTLVSARADLRLSNKAIESTRNYYDADSQAEKWLAKVDSFAALDHADLAEDLMAAGYQIISIEDSQVQIVQSFSIDDNRSLVVELAIDNSGGIDILKWQTTVKRPTGPTG